MMSAAGKPSFAALNVDSVALVNADAMVTVTIEGATRASVDAVLAVLASSLPTTEGEMSSWGYPAPGVRLVVEATAPDANREDAAKRG